MRRVCCRAFRDGLEQGPRSVSLSVAGDAVRLPGVPRLIPPATFYQQSKRLHAQIADMTPDNFLGARGSTRVPLRLTVQLRIKDDKGTFRELVAQTLVVSKYGAKIECQRPLDVNQEVTVTVLPSEKQSGTGRVVWCNSNRSDSGNFELGVELREVKDLWGITFPPERTADSSEVSY